MVLRVGGTQIPKTELKTENYFIAYLDILGGANKILNDKDNKFLNYLNMLYEDVLAEANGFYSNNKNTIVRIFTDNILLAIKTEKHEQNRKDKIQNFINTISNIYNEALRDGYLLRGAVVEGEFFYNDIFVYGKGLVEAIKLEEEIAIYPRIIVSKEIYDLSDGLCITCEDGCAMVNHYIYEANFDCVNFKYSLLEMLKENENNKKVKQKILWMINNFNRHNEWKKSVGYTSFAFIEDSDIEKLYK